MALRELARNLTGLYALWPAAAYGPWLTVAGRTLDRDGLLDYVADRLGGNAALLAAALDDPIDDGPIKGVEYRAVAGAGRTTSAISVSPSGELDFDYGNGDGTVPLESTAPTGVEEPVSYACGVGDTALPGDPSVTARVRAFLLEGDPIQPGDANCPAGGFQIDYRIEDGGGRDDSTIEEAEESDEIERLDLGPRQLIVTNTRTPVALRLGTGRYTLEITPLGPNGGEGGPMRYGTLSGVATIAAGTEAARAPRWARADAGDGTRSVPRRLRPRRRRRHHRRRRRRPRPSSSRG